MPITRFPNGVGTDYDGVLQAQITDISTGASHWTSALPFNVDIVSAYVTQETAVTVADATITFEIGGVAITGLSVTVTAGGAAGDTSTATATALNSLTAGTPIEVITDGGSTTASVGVVNILYKRTA